MLLCIQPHIGQFPVPIGMKIHQERQLAPFAPTPAVKLEHVNETSDAVREEAVVSGTLDKEDVVVVEEDGTDDEVYAAF
ncbi:hypothetical protein N0V88_007300 [Collariella sp. IMI 366227]|nr:hypothetical protein N0V88_007300 [Collariella sp. IMI 366227]